MMLILLVTVMLARRTAGWDGRTAVRVLVITITLSAVACCSNTVTAQDRHRQNLLFGQGRGGDERTPVERKTATHQHLREGTLVPPTMGRIVMLGRRWAFVAAADDIDRHDDVVLSLPSGSMTQARAVAHGGKPRPTRLGRATGRSAKSTMASLVSQNGVFQRKPDEEIPHIIVCENLMLQRIVEAIRADASDDRWTVSGEVTEFFNENRLTIRTAQRANVD